METIKGKYVGKRQNEKNNKCWEVEFRTEDLKTVKFGAWTPWELKTAVADPMGINPPSKAKKGTHLDKLVIGETYTVAYNVNEKDGRKFKNVTNFFHDDKTKQPSVMPQTSTVTEEIRNGCREGIVQNILKSRVGKHSDDSFMLEVLALYMLEKSKTDSKLKTQLDSIMETIKKCIAEVEVDSYDHL